MNKKRGQISTEYLIVIGFVMFAVISILGIAYLYASGIRDTIKSTQIERFADKLISSAESVFYSGEPSQMTFIGYLPEGVNSLQFSGGDVIINYTISSGENFVAFGGNVEIQGSISPTSGIKKFQLVAQQNHVAIVP